MTDPRPLVVVVGASSGIGLAVARDLRADHHVVGMSRGRGDLPETIDHVAVDVTDEGSISAALSSVLAGDRVLRGLVYAAGVAAPARDVDAFDEAEFDHLVAVNVRGALTTLKHAAPALREGSRVVWIGSLASRQGSALSGIAYTTSKAALAGAARHAALQLAPLGVALNVVHPGMTLTPMLEAALDRLTPDRHPTPPPTGHFATPDDTAAVVRFLVTSAPAQLTGAGIDVNGGAFRGA